MRFAVGPEGVRAQHGAIDRLAALLREGKAPGSVDATWAVVAAMTALVAKSLAEDRLPDPDEFETLAEVL